MMIGVVAWVRTFPVRAVRRAITNFDDHIKISSSEVNEILEKETGGRGNDIDSAQSKDLKNFQILIFARILISY